MAQKEIAERSGFDVNTDKESRDETLLQEDVVELMPAVEQANSISEDLDKKMKFELIIVTPEARGELAGRTEEKDPFLDDFKADFHIGSVKVWLKSLAYMIEMKEQLEITNFSGQNVGLLNVEIVPCDDKGKEFTEDDNKFVEDPQLLKGQTLHFAVKIVSARGLPSKFTDTYAKFVFHKDPTPNVTNVVKNTTNPDWNYKKCCTINIVDDEALSYLTDGVIMIQVWGKQKPPKAH